MIDHGFPDDAEAVASAVAAVGRAPELSGALFAALEGGRGPLAVLRRCVEAVVPIFADGCELDLRSGDGIVRIVAGVDAEAAARREREPVPTGAVRHPVLDVLEGGPARLLDITDPHDEPLFGPAELPTSACALGMTTAIVAPIAVGGEVVGSLSFGRGPSGRRFDGDDLAVAVDIARRIALGWHNAVLLTERASILESLHDGLVVSDDTGRVLEVNERWCRMTGYTAEECVGTGWPHPWWPSAVDEDDPGTKAATEAALRADRFETRAVLRRADGSTFPALLSAAPVLDHETGEARAFVVSVKDLTIREAAQSDLAALQRSTAALAAATTVSAVASAVLDEILPRLGATAGVVMLLTPDGQRLRVIERRGYDESTASAWDEVPLARAALTGHAVRDLEIVEVVDHDDAAQRFPEVLDDWRVAGIASAAAAPLIAGGRARGGLALSWAKRHRLGPGERELLAAVAAQCGQALRRAEAFEAEQRASQVLQRRLLADVPVLHARATIATRYAAASGSHAVGGDWYDVVHLDADRIAVAVGDVVGSGIEAAAVMGQLRSALTSAALVDPEPLTVLTALDRVASRTEGAAGATVCYALVDLASGTARLARSGHPPPLLVPVEGDAAYVDVPADPPVGFFHAPRREVTVDLDGGTLVLYTDGLVERRDVGLVERFELLRAAAGAARRGHVEQLVDDVLDACGSDGPRRDDIAVLALRDEPAGDGRFRVLVAALAHEVGGVRRALQAWLLERGVADDVVADVILAVSETVTNAMEHAYSGQPTVAGMVAVTACAEPGEGVTVEVRDAGRWKGQPSNTTRGRGLAIARAMMTDVDVRGGPSGTLVIMHHDKF